MYEIKSVYKIIIARRPKKSKIEVSIFCTNLTKTSLERPYWSFKGIRTVRKVKDATANVSQSKSTDDRPFTDFITIFYKLAAEHITFKGSKC